MFWIQVHDIPIRYMITEVAENICDIICEVVRSIGAETEEGSSFTGLELSSTFRYLCARDESLPWTMGRKLGWHSNVSDCQISVFGVAGCLIVIRTFLCGFKAEECSKMKIENLALLYEHLLIGHQTKR